MDQSHSRKHRITQTRAQYWYFWSNIPTSTATILIFLYVIYILGHGVHFALVFPTYVLAPSFRHLVKRNVFFI